MKKLLTCFVSVLAVLFLIGSVHAMSVAWDQYTDTKATDLRIYSSVDQTNWSILVDSIPTDQVAAEIPNHSQDYQRVYYMMRAHDVVANEESPDSESISFYWTTGGQGHVGPAGIQGIKLLDCAPYDAIADDGSPEWGICNGRFNKH